MSLIKEALEEIFPPDVPRIVRWRLMVAGLIGFLLLHVAWGFGALPGSGFARADEVDVKLAPLKTEISKISVKLDSQDEVLKSIRIDQIATKLRELKRTCCLVGADYDVRERLEQEIERAQREYRSMTAERYPLPPCEAKP